jgi:P-type conjugative transfer protein TrbL
VTINDNGLLNSILGDFTDAISGSWGPSLSAYLLPLLLALVCLQFGMIAIEATIGRDIPLVLMHIMLGILRVGIVVAIFQHAAEWGNDITQTFQQVGQQISGLALGTGPSDVFNQGGQLMQAIFAAKATGHWFTALVQSIEFIFAGLAVMFAWVVASLLYLGALIEIALLAYAGPLIISVTPLSWTFDLLVVWARSLVSIGFKVALILMTLAIGTDLASGWIADMDPATFTSNIWNLLIIVIESVLFAYCVWKVPNRLSGLVPGAAVIGFGEALAGTAANAAQSAGREGLNLAGKGISAAAGPVGHAAAHGAQALGHEAMALMQKVQSKLTS